MKRAFLAFAVLLVAPLAVAEGTAYVAYRAKAKASVDYARGDSAAWENHAGPYGHLMVMDVSVEDGGVTLNRMGVVTFWTQPGGRYYSTAVLSDGVYLYEFDSGAAALIATRSLLGGKPVVTGVDLTVLMTKLAAGPPKALKGTRLVARPDNEIARADLALKLDAKLTAAVSAAAEANPGDPLAAALDVLVADAEAMGYTPQP